jgi:hypothetical protein
MNARLYYRGLFSILGKDRKQTHITYGLDGPRIELRSGRDFPHPSRPALVPNQPPIQGYRVSFPRVKWPGRGADHLPHLTLGSKKQYLYSLLGLRGLLHGEIYLRKIRIR